MTATASLMQRAMQLTDELELKIEDDGGQVIGTIAEIRRSLGVFGSNNEVRAALGLLVRAELVVGTPLESISASPIKKYLYRLSKDPQGALFRRLKRKRIGRPMTTVEIIELLGLTNLIEPDVFDAMMGEMIRDRLIVAPIAERANHPNRQPSNVYLYVELC